MPTRCDKQTATNSSTRCQKPVDHLGECATWLTTAEAQQLRDDYAEAERRRVWREETAARIMGAIIAVLYSKQGMFDIAAEAVEATDFLRRELDKEIPNA